MQRLFDTLEQDDTEVRRRLVDMSRAVTVLRVNEKILTCKYTISQQVETGLRQVMCTVSVTLNSASDYRASGLLLDRTNGLSNYRANGLSD